MFAGAIIVFNIDWPNLVTSGPILFNIFYIFERQCHLLSKPELVMREYSDSEIIECLRNRQSHVVKYLFDRYLPMIKLMIFRMGGSTEDAKDIFQDGLLILIEKIDNKDFVFTCKFKTYLYCVCENLWKSVLMKRKAAANYLSSTSETEADKDINEFIDNKLYDEIFWGVFETLDEVGKKILKLYWQGVSPSEIAEKLGYTYGYVRKKKCKTQIELIERIKKSPGYKQIKNSETVVNNIVN